MFSNLVRMSERQRNRGREGERGKREGLARGAEETWGRTEGDRGARPVAHPAQP